MKPLEALWHSHFLFNESVVCSIILFRYFARLTRQSCGASNSNPRISSEEFDESES
jgi:hypothetical protein